MSSQGSLYCLSNPSIPDLVKIGFTRGSIEERMKQLYSTGVPTPFTLVYKVAVRNPIEREQEAHRCLGSLRCSTKREFFQFREQCEKDMIRELFKRIEREETSSACALAS